MQRESVLMDRVEKGQDEVTVEEPSKVTLKVGRDGATYLLDRTLLRLSSPQFQQLLSTNEIFYEVKDVKSSVFQPIARFLGILAHPDANISTGFLVYLQQNICWHIYTCSEWEFNGDLVETCDLIRAAGNYGLTDLCRNILDRISTLPFDGLVRNSNACYAFDVVQNLEWYGGDFAKKILSYICKNAKAIFTADYFLDLSCGALVEIVREDSLEVDCELDVFKIVLRWGIYNLLKISKIWSGKTLREILEVPLQNIRFRNMTAFELRNYVLSLGILTPELQNVIDEELKFAEYQFDLAEIGISDIVNLPSLKLRKYFLSMSSQRDQYKEASMEEILRAELFVSKFKYHESLGELREEWSLKEAAYKEELSSVNATVQEEIRKHKEYNQGYQVKLEREIARFKQELAQAQASFQEEIRKQNKATLAFQTNINQEIVPLQRGTGRQLSYATKKTVSSNPVKLLSSRQSREDPLRKVAESDFSSLFY